MPKATPIDSRGRPKYQGTLTPKIEAFVEEILLEMAPQRALGREQLREMLKCPVVKAPITVITLIGLSHFGDYAHENEKIQEFIRANFEKMRGSLKHVIAQLFSATWAGCAVAEWGIRMEGKQWMLDRILVLEPKTYAFRGRLGEIEQVRYYGSTDIDIDYAQCLHVVNNPQFSFNDPSGWSDLESADAAVKAWKILLSELVIAGQRQATPLTAGYYDDEQPDTPLFDSEGNPRLNAEGEQVTVSPQEQMAEELEDLENRSVVVTSIKNKIEAIATQADISFFTEALRILHKLILMSFLFPETGLEALGSGDSNLNKGHMALLRANIEQLADHIKEVLLESLIRPLIEWNFGPQDSYGEFPGAPEKEEDRIALFNALSSAVYQQIFSVEDLNVINKLYELAGLPKIDKLPQQEPATPPAPTPTEEAPPPEEDLPSDEAAPPDVQATEDGFGLGLSDIDMSYWRALSNGKQPTAV